MTTKPTDPVAIARSIGDRFVYWQGPSGRPDAARCPFVSEGRFSPMLGHSSPPMTKALYLLFDRTGEERYKESADRYAVFSFTFPRDPVPPYRDRQRQLMLDSAMQKSPETQIDPRAFNNIMSRAWMYGWALDPPYTEFRRHNPEEDCFDARADSLFDWLQMHRTDRGHAYNVGYVSGVAEHPSVTDMAYTDDLRLVGRGLVGYYELTGRQDVLESALRLADYYLRPHTTGSPDGAFVESLGTWCVGPWPISKGFEHFENVRMDQIGWGFSARGAVEFLVRLHDCLPADHFRAPLMKERCSRSVRWQFSCQFDDGAVGMHTQDDKWLGMTAAALLAYADIKNAGWLEESLSTELAPRVDKAKQWLLANATEEFIDQGGYQRITGKTTPHPPENLVWLLAWTVEALLRFDEC